MRGRRQAIFVKPFRTLSGASGVRRCAPATRYSGAQRRTKAITISKTINSTMISSSTSVRYVAAWSETTW